MASSNQQHKQQLPHFLLLPITIYGHFIPMIDLAKMLAKNGVAVTFATTKLNASRLRTTFTRDADSGNQIRLLELYFPALEVGLPDGAENFDKISFSLDDLKKLGDAFNMLQQPVEEFLCRQHPLPSCIVSGAGFTWTAGTARRFGIPWVTFDGSCSFSRLCSHNLRKCNYGADEIDWSDSNRPFSIPDLPRQIQITRAQLPGEFYSKSPELRRLIYSSFKDVESMVDGVLINTFDELEMEWLEAYRKASGRRVWAVGPLCVCNKETQADKVGRGKDDSVDPKLCLKWLDSKSPSSVIYACFGSMYPISTRQLVEIGMGLVASNRPFIWVIRSSSRQQEEMDRWLCDAGGVTEDKGLVIRGWAPQALILSHPSVGGFLTHCGWNSTLEGISAGLPMATWPLAGEQFLNESWLWRCWGSG